VITYIVVWLFTGLVIGALARLLVPRRQSMTVAGTILLGIVGAMVGGFLSWAFFGPRGDMVAYHVADAWPGWLMSIIGAVIVLWGCIAVSRQSS
jgi:uncharacterized membrane protein YeaQ/YmgE (transglycosylase-associated protein family)